MKNASLYIAIRYLWGRAKEGGRYLRGAAAGIALSLVPIIVTLVVADGMIRGITDRYIELGTSHIQVYDFLEDDITGAADTVNYLKETGAGSAIRGAWRERQGLGLIVGSHGRLGATIRAVDSGFWEDPGSSAFLKVVSGSPLLETDREVLLGQTLAETLEAQPGSYIRLMTVHVNEDLSNTPRLTLFKVKGIVSSGYRELDALWCIMNYQAGLELLSPELYRSFLLVKTNDPYRDADAAALDLGSYLGPGYGVYTWKRLETSLYSSFSSTRQMLLFIMAILVLVAAVNVSSATSMLTIERQRDIAVLKTCGAGPGNTQAIFMWGSFFTGLAGALAGGILGLLIGVFINPIIRGLEHALNAVARLWGGGVRILDPEYYLEKIPVIIDWTAVFAIVIFTIACSVLASWLPARRAGKLKPLEILRRI
ncbi:MAG: ABC transporter permease [Treponema sp.]|jgi:lipoprotein-releasing system permease protein|nr:ABC transporter permease [Treponema sp.]